MRHGLGLVTLYSEPRSHRAVLDGRVVSGRNTHSMACCDSGAPTGFGYGPALSGQGSPFPLTSAGSQ